VGQLLQLLHGALDGPIVRSRDAGIASDQRL